MSAETLILNIAEGLSKNSRSWRNSEVTWRELVRRLSKSTRKPTTLKEFLRATKDEQTQIKDVGGYVGGYLSKGRRKPANVVSRQLLTLDVDFATSDFFEDVCFMYDNAAFIHATHKHSPTEPRYRLIMPLDRECSPDEYTAVARRIAGTLGIDKFDNTTFQTHRLMFWPSNPKDVEYYYEEQKGPPICVDDVLSTYRDWTDSSLWPTAEKQIREVGENAKKQEDPRDKRGTVGAFCRTYSIQEAIEKFLPDEYEPATDGRYTYTKGSTACGLIIYDDVFAFSHHGTDPTSGKLCNAFDFVRIHLYGHLDENEKSRKSDAAMEALAIKDEAVRKTIAQEKLQQAKEAFTDADAFDSEGIDEEDFDWMASLEIDGRNNYLSTAQNINLILQNDPKLKGAFRHNEFDNRRYLVHSVPWRKRKLKKPEPMRNVDFSGVRNYIECVYGITSQMKIDDGLTLDAERNSYHPIRQYLKGLKWDGIERVDELLIDYFGAEDSIYTREVIRKMLVASVARVMRPGIKFDTMCVLVDPQQGIGKSTFIRTLGKDWFSDSFSTIAGKEAYEQLIGAWLIEIPELAGLKKAEVETVKHFIAKQEDTYRPAYGRTPEDFPRQNTFWGTTNEIGFLKDPSGDRRYWPIDVRRPFIKRDVFTELAAEVDQIWAEAYELYLDGEPLTLSKRAAALAKAEQQAHSEFDERTGIVLRFLEMNLPKDWAKKDIYDRRTYIGVDAKSDGDPRRFVCVAEIWCECLGKERDTLTRYNTKEINDIMRKLPGWKPGTGGTKNFGMYGTQRYYERIN